MDRRRKHKFFDTPWPAPLTKRHINIDWPFKPSPAAWSDEKEELALIKLFIKGDFGFRGGWGGAYYLFPWPREKGARKSELIEHYKNPRWMPKSI